MKKILTCIIIFLILIAAGFLYFQPKTEKPKPQTPKTMPTPTPTPIPTPPKSLTFFFGGDLMFDRLVNHTFKDIGFDKIFANLDKELFQQNIVFANLEGPVSSQPINDDYLSGSMLFNMPEATVSTLKLLGINGVSLANNHTFNAGNAGFLATQRLLTEAGLKFGGSQSGFDENSVIRYDDSIPTSIVVFNHLAFKNTDAVASAISNEKQAGRFTIVFPHWGNEYQLKHNSIQESIAHKFIDAGADMVVGSHPHVVQDVEIYKNRPIFYSLGNFVFDQLFSEDTQQGLLLTGELKANTLAIQLHPIKGEKMRLRSMTESEKAALLNRINLGEDTISVSLK